MSPQIDGSIARTPKTDDRLHAAFPPAVAGLSAALYPNGRGTASTYFNDHARAGGEEGNDLMPGCEPLAPEEVFDQWRNFEITVERDSEDLRVRVTGELDIATTPELERIFEGLAGDRHYRLLLDLDDLEFMDARGLGAIVGAHRSAELGGNRFTISHCSDQVHRLFEVTNMLDYLTFV
jgi:anti-sigma B factor antagonist